MWAVSPPRCVAIVLLGAICCCCYFSQVSRAEIVGYGELEVRRKAEVDSSAFSLSNM
jgi:hypothetical protein